MGGLGSTASQVLGSFFSSFICVTSQILGRKARLR